MKILIEKLTIHFNYATFPRIAIIRQFCHLFVKVKRTVYPEKKT